MLCMGCQVGEDVSLFAYVLEHLRIFICIVFESAARFSSVFGRCYVLVPVGHGKQLI